MQRRLREALDAHPLVGEVRGFGMLAAIELVPDKPARSFFPQEMEVGTRCRNHAFANGLALRAIRDTMVLEPPLIASESEIDEIVAKAKDAIERTTGDLGKL
jgi:putrescine aminotransferase